MRSFYQTKDKNEQSRKSIEETEMRRQYEERLERYESKFSKLENQISQAQSLILAKTNEAEQIRQTVVDKGKEILQWKEKWESLQSEISILRDKQKASEKDLEDKTLKLVEIISKLNKVEKQQLSIKKQSSVSPSCASRSAIQNSSWKQLNRWQCHGSRSTLSEVRLPDENFITQTSKPQMDNKDMKDLISLISKVNVRSKSKYLYLLSM